MTIHKDAFWNCNTQCFFGVCVCGWAGLGDVVQYLVSDESAEGFSSSYYIHNGIKFNLKKPNFFHVSFFLVKSIQFCRSKEERGTVKKIVLNALSSIDPNIQKKNSIPISLNHKT